jgi:hypothetical protein
MPDERQLSTQPSHSPGNGERQSSTQTPHSTAAQAMAGVARRLSAFPDPVLPRGRLQWAIFALPV